MKTTSAWQPGHGGLAAGYLEGHGEDGQRSGRTLEWNLLVQADPGIRNEMLAFVDVYNLSLSFRHVDNVHHDASFYAHVVKQCYPLLGQTK